MATNTYLSTIKSNKQIGNRNIDTENILMGVRWVGVEVGE